MSSSDNNCPPVLLSSDSVPLILKTSEVKEGYIRFLNQWDWQWFYTLTFVDNVHPEQAHKLFIRWINNLSAKYYGKKHYKRDQYIDWIRSSEYQKRGVLHYHGLLNAPDNFNQFEAMKSWENLDGKFMEEGKTGMSRIHPAEQPAAEIYITKYITKEMNIELSEFLTVKRLCEVGRQSKMTLD